MKILFLEHHPRFIGGSERMSLALCRHARRRGHEAWLVHAQPGDMVSAYAAAGAHCRQLPVFPVAVRRPAQAWRSFRALRALVRTEHIDVIFTSQVSYVSLMAVTGRWTGAKTAVHLGLTYDYPSPVFRAGMRAMDLGIAPSAHTAEDWRRRGWPAAVLRVIPNGVDLEDFGAGNGREPARRRLGLAPDARPLIAYVGRLVGEKGIFTLLRAFATRFRAGGAGHLLLAGTAPGDEVRRLELLARAEGLPDSAWQIRASTPHPEDVYRAADLVVVPSEWEEPFGLVPLEALACGTFTLVSDRGVLPHFVAPIGALATFPAGDANALASRLDHWLQATEPREAAAAVLARHIRAHYDFVQCGDAYLAAFAALLNR